MGLLTILRRRGIVYLARDRFTTPLAAGSVNGTAAEPGPGTRTVNDTAGNKLSLTGGQAVSSGITGGGDPRLLYGPFARIVGRALKYTCTWATTRSGGGWTASATPTGYPDIGISDISGVLTLVPPAQVAFDGLFVGGVAYQILLILRSTGFAVVAKGGTYTDYYLIWLGEVGTVSPYYAVPLLARTADAAMSVDDVEVRDLPGGWAQDFGVAVARTVNPVTGDTLVGVADGMTDLTWTPVAAEVLDLDFRRTDADNRWIVRCDQAAGNVKIFQRVAGVETQRGSTISRTFTIGTPVRVRAWHRGTIVRAFIGDVHMTFYSSASFNQTATGIAASGFTTAINLIAWPGAVSLAPPQTPQAWTVGASLVGGIDTIV